MTKGKTLSDQIEDLSDEKNISPKIFRKKYFHKNVFTKNISKKIFSQYTFIKIYFPKKEANAQ